MSSTLQDLRFIYGIVPVDTNGAAATGTSLNLTAAANMGCSEALCLFGTGNVAANMSAIKLQESADNSAWTDVSGGGFTAANFAATGGDNVLAAAYVKIVPGSLLSTTKYLRLTATGGAGATLLFQVWILAPLAQTPSSVTERGLVEQVII